MTLVGNGKRYTQFKYTLEKDFEDELVAASKDLFGKKTIYINAKKKLESKSIGGSIPDGFFFDFDDPSDPQFYLVEVELTKHSFFSHIFPQVTKFLAFFKNTQLQKSLVGKIFSIIDGDAALKNEFKQYLGQTEIYKFLSDIVEASQNILLISDGRIPELTEITATYTDTWGKLVKHREVRKYHCGTEVIYTIEPDIETLQYEGGEEEDEQEEELLRGERPKYPESYHLDGVSPSTLDIYTRIKSIALNIDRSLIFNSQKYYISIRAGKNIAFIQPRIKKIRLIAMMPEPEIRKNIVHYTVATLSQSVQDFYNGSCAAIDIENAEHIEEIEVLLRRMIEYHKVEE
jgi:predicted transport protein